tara:strand:+ start:33235 stop:34299 length:1065 start_codon:yes stop_codon:yes gene_type:complete
MKKKPHPQKIYNKEELDYDVYWFVYFTWVYGDKTEKDFKTVVKAYSSENAKEILLNKVKRDSQGSVLKSVKTYRIHSRYNLSHHYNKDKKLTIEQWEAIRETAFPNSLDKLYLIEKPRKAGAKTYHGRVYDKEKMKEHLDKHGFKKGKDNWGVKNPISKANAPAEHEKHLYRPAKGGRRGQDYERIPESERRIERAMIAQALVVSNGNRTLAAKILGCHKKDLYIKMKKKHPEIDWDTLYPIGGRPPRSQEAIEKFKETYKKNYKKENHPNYGKKLSKEHVANIVKSRTKDRKKRLKKLEEKLKKLLSKHGNIRTKVAEELGVAVGTVYSYFKQITDVDWEKEYPSPRSRIIKK